MITFPLKKKWFEKIKSGEKTIEYRKVKPYWIKRLSTQFNTPVIEKLLNKEVPYLTFTYFFPCKLRLGYTDKYLYAKISKIEIINGKNTDLNIDKPVFAIHLQYVSEFYTEVLLKTNTNDRTRRKN